MNILKHSRLACRLLGICYLMILMCLLRNDTGMLKIQTEWERDDTQWKYHEWELPEIKAAGISREVYEAYPKYGYAVIPYTPGTEYEPIVITDSSWSAWGKDSCIVSIALGNTVVYRSELPIQHDSITISGQDDVWRLADRIYFIHHALLLIVIVIGLAACAAAFRKRRLYLQRRARALAGWIVANRRRILCTFLICVACLAGGFFYLWGGDYFSPGQTFLPRLERCAYIGALLVLLGISLYSVREKKHPLLMALLLTGLVAVPLYFSLHDVTLFQSQDETNNIKEQMWLGADQFRHWYFGNARTNYLLMGTLWKLIPARYAMVGMEPELFINSFQTAKVLHWGIGFLLSVGLAAFIYRRLTGLKDGSHDPSVLLLLYGGIFTLQIWNCAMKNYNYDLFSLLFCVFGVMLCIDHLLYRRERSRVACLLCLGLGMQEKELVIVYLTIVMVALLAYDIAEGGIRRPVQIVLDSLVIFLTAFLPVLFTDLWVGKVLQGGLKAAKEPGLTAKAVVRSLSILAEELGLPAHPYIWLAVLYGIVLLGGILAAVIGKPLLCFLMKKERYIWLTQGLLALFLLLGGVSVWYRGVILDGKERLDGLADIWLRNIYGHINYIPTVWIILCAMAVICLCIKSLWSRCLSSRVRKETPDLSAKETLLALNEREKTVWVCAATIVGIVTWLNMIALCLQSKAEIMEGRYQNIQILLNVLAVILLVQQLLSRCKWRPVAAALSLAACVCAFRESLPSAPGYTTFYPIWNKEIYREGYLITSGWGVENGEAGEKIEEYCIRNHISFEGANIYSSNYTPWGDNNYGIVCQPLKQAVSEQICEFDENDFYIIFDKSIEENNVQFLLPEDQPYIMSIPYRDVAVVRIYQGSQLKDCYPFNEWE